MTLKVWCEGAKQNIVFREPMTRHFLVQNEGHPFFYEVIQAIIKKAMGTIDKATRVFSLKLGIDQKSNPVKRCPIQNIFCQECLTYLKLKRNTILF